MEQSSVPEASPVSRTQIVIRLLFTVLYLIVFGIVHALVNLATIFQ